MSRSFAAAISLLFLSICAHAQEYVPGEIIVKLKSETDSGAFMGKAMSKMSLQESFGGTNLHHFKLGKGQTVESAIAELKKDPEVLYAEPNYLFRKIDDSSGIHQTFTAGQVQASAATTSAVSASMLSTIGLDKVWTASSVPHNRPIVAVLDTGLDIHHKIIVDSNALWKNAGEIAGNGVDDDGNGYVDDIHGWNFVDYTNNPMDDEGHGTHVAGIIMSVDQNIFAPALQPSKIQIMPLKFLNKSGVGSTSAAIRAIRYAIDNGAVVLNNSWGGPAGSEALREAIAYSYTWGATFVAAAGNTANNNDTSAIYPANYSVPNVISVAATNDYDDLASFSNFGAKTVHLASPGVFVLSAYPNSTFATSSGTSMAAPFVSGTAAHMKIESPQMLGYQVKNIMLDRATRVGKLTGRIATASRLNSWDAISFAKTAAVDPTQPAYAFLGGSSDRQPASAAGGGCALGGGKKSFSFSDKIAIVLLVLAQIVGLVYMRTRASRREKS